jgi:beta-mannanase
MNAPWFPHGSQGQTPQEFIDGWQFMTEQVKNVNENIQMVWCPNIDYPLDPYYPGDDYVDVMGLDGYNKHSQKRYHARNFRPNPSFDELFGQDISYLQNLSSEKPIMIAELGVDPENDSLSWLQDAYQTAAQYDQVTSVYLFGWNKEKGIFDHSEANWGEVITPEFQDMIEGIPAYRGPVISSPYA